MSFEVNRADPQHIVAMRSDMVLSVLDGGQVFHRNAIRKHLKTGQTEHLSWLVAELDGVRLYINEENNLVLTRQDLNP